jgi:hypothetical protein
MEGAHIYHPSSCRILSALSTTNSAANPNKVPTRQPNLVQKCPQAIATITPQNPKHDLGKTPEENKYSQYKLLVEGPSQI